MDVTTRLISPISRTLGPLQGPIGVGTEIEKTSTPQKTPGGPSSQPAIVSLPVEAPASKFGSENNVTANNIDNAFSKQKDYPINISKIAQVKPVKLEQKTIKPIVNVVNRKFKTSNSIKKRIKR